MKGLYEVPYSVSRLENMRHDEEGYGAPTKVEEGTKKVKPISEWTDKELELANLNSRALGTLINSLMHSEFYKIMNLTCAKELWDYLEITHEGTSHVKQSKINM